MTPTYSVVVVTRNGLQHTVQCVESLGRTLPLGSELIVVDNGSEDGTRAYLEDVVRKTDGAARTILLDRNEGWCHGVNLGFEAARGKYLVMLNNDVVVTPLWLDGLRECMDDAPSVVPGLRRVGLVGPVTNAAGGPQGVAQAPPYDPATLDRHSLLHRETLRREWGPSFFLSGFCLMMHRDCYDEIGGLDERFSPGGFDDNDLVLRAQERGWECVIAGDVYVHHSGGATFRSEYPEKRSGLVNRGCFHEKWRKHHSGPKRLVAAYRVKDVENTLGESLDATARFADAIVVLDDGSSDGTRALCEQHPAVTSYEHQSLPFDERRDRNRVLAMAGELDPDWIISIDGDEVFEMDRARADHLMHLADPHAKVLGFHWYTFWEPSRSYFRADGVFGGMSGLRMYKHEPGLEIVAGDEIGLHCGNIPQFPDGAARYTDVRVRHLGYDCEELRKAKFEFYRRMDPSPRVEMVGNADYSHLVSTDVDLRRYAPESGLSLCLITRDEEENLEQFLAFFEPYVDEICIVDHGSRDRTVEVTRLFTDKIGSFPAEKLELDQTRNQCLEMASQPWILSLDPDESIAVDDFPRLQRLMDDLEVDVYTFDVANHQKDQGPIMTVAARLFRNDPRIRYSRPVHETVEESAVRHPELRFKAAGMLIEHFGFLKDDAQVASKIRRYFERNREYREQSPDDPMPWYNEALTYLNEGREEDAVAFFRKAIELDPDFLSARSQLAYIYQERAMELWRSLGARTPPGHPMHARAENAFRALEGITPQRPVIGRNPNGTGGPER
jgi:GT2 family glycosyltransferase/tetratricopeptide (TPR) repeat protein